MITLAVILMVTFVSAQNISQIQVSTDEDPIFGFLTREHLIILVVAIIVVYVLIRILLKLRERSVKKREGVISDKDRISNLQAEKKRLQNMTEAARKSFYKRELSEEEANKLMFEYKQQIIEIDGELKRLGGAS